MTVPLSIQQSSTQSLAPNERSSYAKRVQLSGLEVRPEEKHAFARSPADPPSPYPLSSLVSYHSAYLDMITWSLAKYVYGPNGYLIVPMSTLIGVAFVCLYAIFHRVSMCGP